MPQVRRPRPLASPQGSPQAADQSSAARRTTRAARAGEVTMMVSIPLVAILGVAVFVAYRYMGLRVWQAILCLLFGFLLAASTAAPHIRDAITTVVQWLDGSKP
jgi:hypothetical protein